MNTNVLVCQDVTLDGEAIDYIIERLNQGKTLATHLLSKSLRSGVVRTLLPVSADHSTLLNFYEGGKLPSLPQSTWRQIQGGYAVPIPSTDACLAEVIQRFLAQSDQHLCIFEDNLASATDPGLKTVASVICTYNDEVYYLLTHQDAVGDLHRIETTIRDAQSIPTFIGVLTSWRSKGGKFLTTSGQLTEDSLTQLALRAEQIIVGAYDGESYLIWAQDNHRVA